jgi:hypothetical protein
MFIFGLKIDMYQRYVRAVNILSGQYFRADGTGQSDNLEMLRALGLVELVRQR